MADFKQVQVLDDTEVLEILVCFGTPAIFGGFRRPRRTKYALSSPPLYVHVGRSGQPVLLATAKPVTSALIKFLGAVQIIVGPSIALHIARN